MKLALSMIAALMPGALAMPGGFSQVPVDDEGVLKVSKVNHATLLAKSCLSVCAELCDNGGSLADERRGKRSPVALRVVGELTLIYLLLYCRPFPSQESF